MGASNSLWASHCSRFTDESSPVKRIFWWRLDGGGWFIPTILEESDESAKNYGELLRIVAEANEAASLAADVGEAELATLRFSSIGAYAAFLNEIGVLAPAKSHYEEMIEGISPGIYDLVFSAYGLDDQLLTQAKYQFSLSERDAVAFADAALAASQHLGIPEYNPLAQNGVPVIIHDTVGASN